MKIDLDRSVLKVWVSKDTPKTKADEAFHKGT